MLSAGAAAIAAWRQTRDYTTLKDAYEVTSHEIVIVAGELPAAGRSEEAWSQLVHDAAAAFSREHTLWLVRRQGSL
jgi:hypothetical protein